MTATFLLAAIATALLLRLPLFDKWRVEALAAASLPFVVESSDCMADVACLLAMAATGWVFIRALSRLKNDLLLAFGIGCVLAEFLCVRQILPHVPAASIGRTIGLSYVMFRVIHLIVDAHGTELPPRLRLRDYACYLFCYLTFLAGPIQRVQEFAEATRRPLSIGWRQATAASAPAIVTGYFKYTVLAGFFFAAFDWSQSRTTQVPDALLHAVGWLSFTGYLYASFSGYTDVMRGIGGLIELDLPPNFDRPFAAANFLDLWSRWHITLSEWFKLYVFNPLVKSLIARARPGLVPYLGMAGFFVAFFLMGLWHGISLRYMVYGICLGAGVSINKFYQYTLQRRLGRARASALTRHPLHAAAARALAVSFFVVALGFLWIPGMSMDAATLGHWIAGAVLVVAAVSLAGLAEPTLAAMPSGSNVRVAVCIAQIAAVLLYLVLLDGTAPPLLYEFF